MRLKEDSDSWKSNGIIKRDFRHDHSDSFLRKKASKKDTKKWCKGKVGVPHQYRIVEESILSGLSANIKWTTEKCSACGKKNLSTFQLRRSSFS